MSFAPTLKKIPSSRIFSEAGQVRQFEYNKTILAGVAKW